MHAAVEAKLRAGERRTPPSTRAVGSCYLALVVCHDNMLHRGDIDLRCTRIVKFIMNHVIINGFS